MAQILEEVLPIEELEAVLAPKVEEEQIQQEKTYLDHYKKDMATSTTSAAISVVPAQEVLLF